MTAKKVIFLTLQNPLDGISIENFVRYRISITKCNKSISPVYSYIMFLNRLSSTVSRRSDAIVRLRRVGTRAIDLRESSPRKEHYKATFSVSTCVCVCVCVNSLK